jgi:hypothetical protein
MIQQLGQFLTVLGLGIQVGAKVHFSFVLTPTLFAHLPQEEAGRAVRLGFPGYHLTGMAALGLSLLSALALGRPTPLLLLIGAALAVELYAGIELLPRIARARGRLLDAEQPEESDPAHQEWKRLHRLGVQLNLAALGLGLASLWAALL